MCLVYEHHCFSFHSYDLRVPDCVSKKNSKSHTIGVTAMISDRLKQNQIITG